MLSADLAAASRSRSVAGGRSIITSLRQRSVERAARWVLPLLGILLALTALLAPAPGQVAVLIIVIAFGVPHGALDGEIVRPLLRPLLGSAWFGVFALPYLGLSALVLLAWHEAPIAALAAFLGLSVLHFGLEDAGADPLGIAVRGGLPIALPVLLHPAATTAVFGAVAGVSMPVPPMWLLLGAQLWAVLVPFYLLRQRRQRAVLTELALLAAAFIVLPPLAAFAIYFVCFHAPAHMRAIVRNGRAPRVASMPAASWRSLPITLLTLAIGAALWPWVGTGPVEAHLLSLTIRCLAALTVPHMLLDGLSATPGWQRTILKTRLTPA